MPPLRSTIDHIRRLVRPRPIHDTDRALLAAFASTRDDAAFAELVRRHGSLVRGVCRRVLGSDPTVDDVFQATFLLLARKAGSRGWRDSVAGWLHATAGHVARKARRAALRRQRHEASGGRQPPESFGGTPGADAPGSPDPCAAAAWSELCQVLDQELARLPERLRAPLVLCYLEGRTRDEAAIRLGWPLGTLKHRLTRARALLRSRLTRRGVSLAVAGLPAALAGESVSSATAMDVARLAAGYVCGEALAGSVAVLVRGGSTLGGAKTALATGAVLLIGLIGIGASRGRQRPEDSPEKKTPVAHAPGSPNAPREPLPLGAVARLGTLAFCHGESVQQILTSSDGHSIISLGGQAVRIWNAESGREEGAILAPDKQFFAAGSLLPGGDLLALSWGDGSVHIWDWRVRKEVSSFTPELDNGRAIGFARYAHAADGHMAVLIIQEGSAYLVDLLTGKVTSELSGHTKPIVQATFSADGKTVVTAAIDRTIRFWAVATGKEVRQVASPVEVVERLTLSPGGRWLAVAGATRKVVPFNGGTMALNEIDKNVHLLDLSVGREVHQFDSGANDPDAPTMLFSPDSRSLITGGDAGDGQPVREWNVTTGKKVREFPGQVSASPALAMSRDKRTFITADTVIRFWDWRSGREKTEAAQNPGSASALVFLPDGRSLITCGSELAVWDAVTGRELRRLTEPRGRVDGIALAPDGRTMAVLRHSGETRDLAIIEPATGRQLRTAPKAGIEFTFGPVLSADGRSIAAASFGDSTVRIWDAATLAEPRAVKLPVPPGGKLSFSPDGRTLRGVMGGWGPLQSEEQVLFSIDTATGKLTEHNGLGPTNQFSAWSYSPDGQMLAAAGLVGGPRHQRGAIRLYEAATGKLVREFTDVSFTTNQIAFSPDGKWLASGADGPVVIWDVATGKRVHEFTGHRGRVVSLRFSIDGKRLASGSDDTTVLIWDASNLHPTKP